jgi:phage-related protein
MPVKKPPPPLLPRELLWIGSSEDDIAAMPRPVKASFGYRLRQLQNGETPHDIKALPQLGAGVYELRESFERNAYRVLYVLNLREAI